MSTPAREATAEQDRRSRLLPLIVQLGSFVLILGIPDGALGVLWPSMRATFHLPLDALGVLTVAATVLYFAGGIAGGRLHERVDVGRVMLGSCAVALAGLAAWGAAPRWLFVLGGVALLGLSRGVIDAVLNAEAALDGGVRRLGFLHACWAVGGTLGPVLVAAAIAAAGNWRVAPVVVAVGVVLLMPFAAAETRLSRPRRVRLGEALATGSADSPEGAPDHTEPIPTGPEQPARPARPAGPAGARRLVLGLTVVTFAVYCAAEIGPIAWGYTYLLSDRHLSRGFAAAAIAAFWAALTLGRFALAVAGDRAEDDRVLEWSAILMVLGAAVFWLAPGAWSVVGLPIAGLGSAAVFPMLMALTPSRLGPEATSRAVGASIAASAVGGPVAVALFGVLAQHLGVGVLGACLFAAAAAMYVVNRVLTVVTRNLAV